MSIAELLRRLADNGIRLTVEGDGLRYRGPKGNLTAELRAAISANKAGLIGFLSSEAAVERLEFSRDPANRYQPFPLTDLQQAYLVGERDFYSDPTVAHLYQRYVVPELALDRFRSAVRSVIRVHDALRLAVLPDGRQVVRATSSYEPAYEDLRALRPEQAKHRVEQRGRDFAGELAPVEAGPMWSVAVQQLPDRSYIHFAVRLFAFDAVTLNAIYRDMIGFYEDPDYLPPLGELSFRDYVLGLGRYRATTLYRRSLEYWRGRARALPAAPDLPRARSAPGSRASRLERMSGRLPAELWARLREQARDQERPINSVLCTVYTDTLARWAANRPFTINLLSANRPPVEPETGRVVGNCSTTTLLEVSGGGATFIERVEQLQRRLYAELSHNVVSGVEVIRELARLTPGNREPLMPIVFSSGIALLGGTAANATFELLVPSAAFQLVDARLSTPQVWLDHQVMEQRGELVFNWDYALDRFPSGLAEEMFDHYRAHLEDLASRPAAWQAPWFELSDRHLAARRRANDTALELPSGTLYSLFEAAERRDPDATAVFSEKVTLSYRETGALAAQVSALLRERGVQPGALVGVYLSKSAEQIVATLGVLHAGAAYLPLDAKLPPARVHKILAHSKARALVVDDQTMLHAAGLEGVEIVRMPVRDVVAEGAIAAKASKRWAPVAVSDDAVAYVIYTSGSTGQPKGVVIDHRGAVNTIRDVNRRFEVHAKDRVFALSSLGFDLSVFDIFGAFAVGAAIVVPAEDDVPNPKLWIDALERFRPTIWNSVPALLEMTLDYANDDHPAWLGALRVILLSGDWIPLPLAERLLRTCPAARLIALGGATEASIWSNYFEVREIDPAWSSIPYGFPLANQTFAVLDRDMRMAPTWVHGDLYIGGIGVAKGYLNDPEKTAASFVIHPATGERLYRTGDRGRYLPDGAIEFAGREDAQVKIRGFRVELGEIEAVLRSAPGVESAVAVAQGAGMRNRQLVAFVVAPGLSAAELETIRIGLRNELPSYMVPAVVLPIASVPLSANGKVDRGALKVTALPSGEETRARRPPESPIEIRLGALWHEILAATDLSASDDFFAVGGNSLQAVRLFNGIERVFGLRLPLSSLFRTCTIAEQAVLIAERAEGRDLSASSLSSPLVTLRKGTSDHEVLVLIHPVGGDVLCYRDLARALPEVLTIAGIRAPALDSGNAPPDTLEEAASHYVQTLLKSHPKARVHLGGWSMGGVVAYECARRLQALGHPVGKLFMIDSWLGHSRASQEEFAMIEGFFIDLLGSADVRGLVSDARRAPGAERLSVAYDLLERSGRMPRDIGLPHAARLYAVYSANMRALERYRIEPYAGPVILFEAARQRKDTFPNLRPFVDRAGELVPGHRRIELPVDHYEIMRGEAISKIAKTISSVFHGVPMEALSGG